MASSIVRGLDEAGTPRGQARGDSRSPHVPSSRNRAGRLEILGLVPPRGYVSRCTDRARRAIRLRYLAEVHDVHQRLNSRGVHGCFGMTADRPRSRRPPRNEPCPYQWPKAVEPRAHSLGARPGQGLCGSCRRRPNDPAANRESRRERDSPVVLSAPAQRSAGTHSQDRSSTNWLLNLPCNRCPGRRCRLAYQLE
jgi:hypothetical protein